MNSAIQFEYVNHRIQKHKYTVLPLSVYFGPCMCFPDNPNKEAWVMKAFVLDRSGEARHVIRHFALVKLENVTEVPLETG